MLRVLHLVASGAFIFFRGGVAVASSPVAAVVACEGAAVAEAPAVFLAAAAPVKGAAVAKDAAVALAAAAPLEGAAVTEAAAVVLAAAASILGFVAVVALAAAMDEAAAVGLGSLLLVQPSLSPLSVVLLPPCIRLVPLCLLWENCCFPAAEGDLLNTSPRFQLYPGPDTPLNTLLVYSKQAGGHCRAGRVVLSVRGGRSLLSICHLSPPMTPLYHTEEGGY
jgi:hypothetical protein